MLSLWVLLLAVVAWYFYVHYKNRRLYELGEKFPGPRTIPLLGNTLDLAGGSTSGLFNKLVQFADEYGRFYRVWNDGKLFLIFKDARDMEVVLSSNIHTYKSLLYRYTVPWIGRGLISGSGPTWKSHRKIITPTFHFKILDQFIEVFNRNAVIMCGRLQDLAGKGPFNVYPYTNHVALDNICETAMGINMNIQKNSDSSYLKAVSTVCHSIAVRFFKTWLMKDFIFNLSQYAKEQKEALKLLHGVTENVIQNRKQNIARKQANKEAEGDDFDSNIGQKKKKAFLDLLLESTEGSQLTDRQIREEVDTFMFAGHDTISAGTSFALYLLAAHPEVQEKVYEELQEIFGGSDRPATMRDVSEMKYLERVIKEAQRLYPSVPLISREIHEDFELEGGYIVPAGAQLVLMIYSLHRDPKIWPEPEKFDPERFTLDACKNRNPYAFVPFSAGARNCIGQRFAVISTKITLSSIIRRFKLLPSPYEKDKVQVAAEMVLVSKNGHHIRVETRK